MFESFLLQSLVFGPGGRVFYVGFEGLFRKVWVGDMGEDGRKLRRGGKYEVLLF